MPLPVADAREPQALISDLDEVTESLQIYPAAGGGRGRPRTAAVISETTTRQHSLLKASRALGIEP